MQRLEKIINGLSVKCKSPENQTLAIELSTLLQDCHGTQDELKRAAFKFLIDNKITLSYIAQFLGIEIKKVRAELEKYNLHKYYNRTTEQKRKDRHQKNKARYSNLVKLIEQGKSLAEMGRQYNRSHECMRQIINNNPNLWEFWKLVKEQRKEYTKLKNAFARVLYPRKLSSKAGMIRTLIQTHTIEEIANLKGIKPCSVQQTLFAYNLCEEYRKYHPEYRRGRVMKASEIKLQQYPSLVSYALNGLSHEDIGKNLHVSPSYARYLLKKCNLFNVWQQKIMEKRMETFIYRAWQALIPHQKEYACIPNSWKYSSLTNVVENSLRF